LEIQYLLQLWVAVHTCQLIDSANLVDHHAVLLVQIGALVDLQLELQSANMSTNLVQLGLALNLMNNSKSVENQKKLQLQKLFQITSSSSIKFWGFFSPLNYFPRREFIFCRLF
jgi:hypothetical protein